MKKLFEVTKKWYVLAENELEAEIVNSFLVEPSVEVREARSVDADWFDAIPAGDKTGRTCGQILADKI